MTRQAFIKRVSSASVMTTALKKRIGDIYRNQLEISEEHDITSWLFLKCLALIYFSAFLSLTGQIAGLAGTDGILPFSELLDDAYQAYGFAALLYLPGLFWLNSSDLALQGIAWSGCLLSASLLLGYRTRLSLILLFVCYLSLFHAGQTFLTFQWDSLLLETGFLAIFLARGPSHLVIFLYHWLLFRLRFMSGVSKLASGDPSWANLTTLNYYFETQPLPHVGSWYFHQLPEWMLHSGVVFVLFTELIIPFFIFLPRKYRIFAAATTVAIQLLIIATSNHNWINLLTIVLCLFLIDDRLIEKITPSRYTHKLSLQVKPEPEKHILPIIAFLIVTCSSVVFLHKFAGLRIPDVVANASIIIRSWGIGHIFHVFPTMQTERHELQVEGSFDGKDWKAYTFRYKPGSLTTRPAFIIPHQPRLDWMMWFVPPQPPEMMYWFDQFLTRLQQGSEPVLDLLADNPFPDKPPRYLRVVVFRYHFTTSKERAETGQWWKYEYLGLFPYVQPRNP